MNYLISSISRCLILIMAMSPLAAQDEAQYCCKANSMKHLFDYQLRSLQATNNYDLKYYRFEWFVDPSVYQISGTATPYFEIMEDGFTSMIFDFSTILTVDSIIWRNEKLAFEQTGEYTLQVSFPQTLMKSSVDSISITYHGAPVSGGFGSFIQGQHASQPIIWTLSEPFGAQDWWPCKNGLEDKIDSMDVLITTLDKYRAASNGSLVGEYAAGSGLTTYHWKHKYMIAPYLVALAVTNYTVYTDDVLLSDGKVMPMLNYIFPEDLNAARIGTDANVKVLQFYDSLFVSYPFKNEKYGHAQFGWGGGMEHQTMSFVINFGYGLLAHELAHQWFGDYVTCGDWQDIWLNEGFATYLEGLSRERFPQSNNDWYNWKSGKVNSILSSVSGSVKVDDPTNINRIFSSRLSYNKGSYLLHMLRWKLGDEHFFEGLRNYLKERAYSYARTNDLKVHLEQISGESLDEYFKDWFEGQGYPIYDVQWEQEGDQFYVNLSQVTSHNSVSFFEMPVPLRLSGEGQEMMIRIDHNENNQLFSATPGFKVEKVEFDPLLWLVAKSTVTQADIVSGTEEALTNGIHIFPNPVKDVMTIQINDAGYLNYLFTDISGKIIKKGNLEVGDQTIDLTNLPKGSYVIKCTGKGKESLYEIVKL